MTQLVQACVANDITDLIIIHEHRGDPGQLIILRVIMTRFFFHLLIIPYFGNYCGILLFLMQTLEVFLKCIIHF